MDTLHTTQSLNGYRDRAAKIIFNPFSVQCYIPKCNECRRPNALMEQIQQVYDENILQILHTNNEYPWNRLSLEIFHSSTDELLKNFLIN